MGLTLVATPIGHRDDISLRAIGLLKSADLIIGEEFKEVSKLLKFLEIEKKELRVLNEHSKEDDVAELCKECKTKNVVLVSDCGTPGFCDPGFQLVKACRSKQIAVASAPGASSLMTLLSHSSERINDFYFRGFLPAETEAREQAFANLKKTSEPVVLMDTPYRLLKILAELQKFIPRRRMLLGLSLTQETEKVYEGTVEEVIQQLNADKIEKAEFILLIYKNNALYGQEKKLESQEKEMKNSSARNEEPSRSKPAYQKAKSSKHSHSHSRSRFKK